VSTDFVLEPEDAAALRHLASVEPVDARRWLQDRPELARRMTSWPPELRIEVCRIIYRSFGDEQRRRLEERHARGGSLLSLLEDEA
jgi:hypothetical protein